MRTMAMTMQSATITIVHGLGVPSFLLFGICSPFLYPTYALLCPCRVCSRLAAPPQGCSTIATDGPGLRAAAGAC